MSEQEALEFSVNVIRRVGGNVGDYDEEAGTLMAWLNDTHADIDLNKVARLDRESARRYVEGQLQAADVPANKWTPYLNHAVLVRCNTASPSVLPHAILDVRVESISPSGKYVRFMGLSQNMTIWAPVDSYDLLEDLGERKQPAKPILTKR